MNNHVITICNTCFLGLLFCLAPQVWAEVNDYECGQLNNAYGPFDYRKDKKELPVVEHFHFTPEIANLIRGKSGSIGAELDYTLRAFPNHPQALMSMVRYGEKTRKNHPPDTQYSVECYLNRALRFGPDDGNVRMIYAVYLARKGRNSEALVHLNQAVALGVDSPNLNYNIGLVYFQLNDFDKALSFAHKAYQAAYPLPGLRNKLKKAGHWKEPEALKELPQEVKNDNAESTPTK